MTFRAQCVFPYFTNLPGDVMTNTLHFDSMAIPGDLVVVADTITPLLATFYSSVYGGAFDMAPYMLPDNSVVNWYDLSAPPPRVPYTKELVNGISLSASVIPTEVACVLSFQAPQVSGEPQARRRGRIYLGAITTAMLDPATGLQFPRFNTGYMTTVANSATNLVDQVQASGHRWVVWSQVDQASSNITNGWVDNTPDTQRRRGVDTTVRTLWSEAP